MTDFRHPSIDHVTAVLRAGDWDGTVHAFADGVRTAQAAADGLGCDVGAIANSLVFQTDAGEPLLIITSGRHRVDLDRMAAAYGIRIARRCESSSTTAAKGLRAIHGVAPAITTAAVHDPR